MDNLMKDTHSHLIYSGTSGIVLPVAKHAFPEAFKHESRLSYYGTLFNSLEINSSFKKLPMARTVEKWAAIVPGDFRFTFKLSKSITHNKHLHFETADVQRFFQVVDHAGDKKGCVLIQFPGKITVDESGQLKELLSAIRQSDPGIKWQVATEFRHTSWYTDQTYQLLEEYHSAIVFHDLNFTGPPTNKVVSRVAYVRFHGTEKGYRGSYSDAVLSDYAQRIQSWTADGNTVYIYFNNTLGDAANNLTTLHRMLKTLT
jgi:uncharacterized protein YecE (DUF72 family)